jgi:hypothetical protein
VRGRRFLCDSVLQRTSGDADLRISEVKSFEHARRCSGRQGIESVLSRSINVRLFGKLSPVSRVEQVVRLMPALGVMTDCTYGRR